MLKLFYDEAMLLHKNGSGHPESPRRLGAVVDALAGARLPNVSWAAPSRARKEDLLRVHAGAHVDMLESLRGRSARLDPDTMMSPHSQAAAWLAAGAASDAVDAVMAGADKAFALVRPPGHHAEPGRAMGFCLLNNAAIAAARAIDVHGCKRVLLIDWDVHHGNGTQHAFENRSDVLFFSTHRFPFYPGTGALDEVGYGEGRGFTVNVPMNRGLGDEAYAGVFDHVLRPLADAYAPDLVVVSAGFDAHRDDPIGDQHISDDGFAYLCGVVDDVARQWAGGRLVLILEGGYDPGGISRSAVACAQVLCGAEPPEMKGPASEGRELIRGVRAFQQRFWSALPA